MMVTVSKNEGIVVFRLKGKFISLNIGKVMETVGQSLNGIALSPKLVFDFKEITRIDGAGLGHL